MYKERFFHDDLENLTEEIVFQEMHAFLEQGGACDFCTCDVCVQDIAAIVLNKVPSLYCTSLVEKLSPGKGLSRRIEEVRELVREAIPGAVETVRKFHHH